MLPKSIRWRLLLSYAGIALLAALSLGVVLLTTLRSYYLQQELDYLTNNARGISLELARMVEAELPPAALQAQLKNFSFLAQSRVRLLDKEGQVWADSGEPKDRRQVIALSVEVEANSSEPADVLTKAITETGPGKVKVTGYAPFLYLEEPGFAVPTTGEPVTRTLIITRNGVGVEVFHLFSRFHRGRNAAAHPGSGLGLAIVKAIVEAHGGQVKAEQREPGACFVLRLPGKQP